MAGRAHGGRASPHANNGSAKKLVPLVRRLQWPVPGIQSPPRLSKIRRMDERRIVVTGLGAVTSLGNDLASTWEGLVAGRCGIGPITLFDASAFRTKLAAEIKELPSGFDPVLRRRLSRTDVIGLTAAAEALADADLDLDREDPSRIGVVLGGGVSGLLDSENYFRD